MLLRHEKELIYAIKKAAKQPRRRQAARPKVDIGESPESEK